MSNPHSLSDEEWLEHGDNCQRCGKSECGDHCKGVASMIMNNTHALVTQDKDEYENLSIPEIMMRIAQCMDSDSTHQALRGADLSGVIPNATTELPEPESDESDTDANIDNEPPQVLRGNLPGVEVVMAKLRIENEDTESIWESSPAMLQEISDGYDIEKESFENDTEIAMYVITRAQCAYNTARRSSSAEEVKKLMNGALDIIRQDINLEIPVDIVTTLYDIWSAEKGTYSHSDNAKSFDGLGETFGQAYLALTGNSNDDDGNDDDDDDDDGGGAGGGGGGDGSDDDNNSEGDDDNNYYSEEEDSNGALWLDEYDESESESEDDWEESEDDWDPEDEEKDDDLGDGNEDNGRRNVRRRYG